MAVNKKVCIGIPNKGEMKTDTVISLLAVLNATPCETLVIAQTGPAVDFNRNFICHTALNNEATHVLFIDTDMKFPRDTLNQLLALEKPVVGVASRKKVRPPVYTIEVDEPTGPRNMTPEELPDKPFNRINGYPILVGTGIMLIDLKTVNEAMFTPWFKFEAQWDKKNVGYQGEDIYFCRKVWKSGLEVWCDPTISIGHIGDFEY